MLNDFESVMTCVASAAVEARDPHQLASVVRLDIPLRAADAD